MRILVTGAAGFIGSHLAERLAELGHEVRGIDCFTDYYSRELKQLNAEDIRARGVELLEPDLATDDLAPALDGIQVVYHCAAQPGISATTPFQTYERNNIQASYRLLEAARKAGLDGCFINVATSSIYGYHATDPEDSPPKPTSYYGVTKLAAEQLALAYQREGKLPACSLRLFSVYGERERPEKLFPLLMHHILAGTEFPLYQGSEEHSRSFTYVSDIVDGFVAVLDRLEDCQGEIFNIGSDIEITTGEAIRIVQEILGREARIKRMPRRPGDQLRTHADITKARRILDYQPKVSPREGFQRAADWYREKVFGNIAVYE